MKTPVITLSIALLVCILITGGYFVALYRDAQKQLPEWQESCRETFVGALQIELKKRGDVSVDVITVNSVKAHTLDEPIPDSVTLASRYGEKVYKIPREKFINSLVKESKKRMLLSILLESYPVSVDTLNRNWDSLLLARKIVANTYIRYSITDLEECTTVIYSNKYKQNQQADSLISRYMGYRFEIEATGFAFYKWWQIIEWWQWALLLLPWGFLCALALAYKRLRSFLRRKFRVKEIVIQEIEKETHVMDVEVDKVDIYKLKDGTRFDPIRRTLRNGDKEKNISPQMVVILKLFFKSKNLCLDEYEIYKKMWKDGGDPTRLSSLMFRLRKTLEDISFMTVVYDGNGIYQLKMLDSIEENEGPRESGVS